VAITGPSGCGKSTLLHAIAALERPDSGEIVVNGEPITGRRDLSGYRSRTIGLVFQLHNLLPNLTASENVQVPMYELALSPGARRRRARELLALVDLSDKANKRPTALSGGERQRVAIARALSNGPPIVLADEPTGNLDSKAGQRVLEGLREVQRRRGVTLVLVTHDASIAQAADRVVHMLDGRIDAAGEKGPAG
jgi:ABC-type lipoprotein export system ATPase subunit